MSIINTDQDSLSVCIVTITVILFMYNFYSPIAFDERVTFWLQHAWSGVFAALCACAIA